MKFECPHCGKFSKLDLDEKPSLNTKDFLTCQLCKKKSFVRIAALPSKSEARRVLTQMGVDILKEDPGLYAKEGP